MLIFNSLNVDEFRRAAHRPIVMADPRAIPASLLCAGVYYAKGRMTAYNHL